MKGKTQILPYYGDAQTLPITIDVLNSVFVLEILKKCVNFWIGRVKMAKNGLVQRKKKMQQNQHFLHQNIDFRPKNI